MRGLPANVARGLVLLGVLAVLTGGWAKGQDTPKVPPPDKQPAKKEKTFAFEMRDKPWGAVLEWLSEITGLPINTDDKPTGTLTFIGGKKEYTIPQIVDILNDNLKLQK